MELVRWAAKNRIPLTPRGKASSGYGGVLPVKKGIVVDFYRMNSVIKIDPEPQTATVQAGMVWEKLDRELAKQGLTLRLYPTSYPVIHRRRLAGPGRSGHRLLRGGLVPRQRGQRPRGAA